MAARRRDEVEDHAVPWRSEARTVRPMLASLGAARLDDERVAYERKYDGIRALIEIEPRRGRASRSAFAAQGESVSNPSGIRIWSRLGNEKTAQFPDVVQALARFARTLEAPVLLDGEIVAIDDHGEPTGFQQIQSRIHSQIRLARRPRSGSPYHVTGASARAAQPVTFIAFDVLREGGEDLRPLPLNARRARLERIRGTAGVDAFRLSELAAGDGRALHADALARGWEGLIAKRLDSPYRSGQRSPEWTKLKLINRAEFVIGGFTEPRGTRAHFGSLLLGVPKDGELHYVGHAGTGFTHAELTRLHRMMKPLETTTCPFRVRPRTNERPHWIEPKLVAEVAFTEVTADGKLRAPAYVGLRDDAEVGVSSPGPGAPASPRPRGRLAWVIDQLDDLESRRVDGVLALPDGAMLPVCNLSKVLWPELRITKGDLMRYYVRMASLILPAVDDRPLVMKRFPNGIHAKAFYQQRAPAGVPDGVRVDALPSDTEVPSRIVGGELITLLYMAQLAVISQDPWFSRVQSPDDADHVAFDLDPMPGVTFAQVADVARFVHDELERLRIPSVPKTSGADGIHIYVPLRQGTSYETGRLFCQIVATVVADRHPRLATVERSVHARGRTVYIDYLQNIRAKTLATAYSVRASDFAGVSTPLDWDDVRPGLDARAFTMRTIGDRVSAVGDLWARLRTTKGADLRAALRYGDGSSAC